MDNPHFLSIFTIFLDHFYGTFWPAPDGDVSGRGGRNGCAGRQALLTRRSSVLEKDATHKIDIYNIYLTYIII